MGLSARWAGGWPRPRQVPGEGGNGGPVTLGRTGRRLARLSRGGAEDDRGPLLTLSSLRVRSLGGRPAGATPGEGLSLRGARGAGSRRCQELRALGLDRTGRERALRPGYKSSLFSVIALAREQVPWRHLEPEMSIDLLRL